MAEAFLVVRAFGHLTNLGRAPRRRSDRALYGVAKAVVIEGLEAGEGGPTWTRHLLPKRLGSLSAFEEEACGAEDGLRSELKSGGLGKPFPCTGVSEGAPLPTKFALAQSVPNPFANHTEIRYDVPHECEVRLEVFDVAGRQVAVLVDRRESAGSRSVHWSGNGVANGVYFYQLTAGEFEETKRLILLR